MATTTKKNNTIVSATAVAKTTAVKTGFTLNGVKAVYDRSAKTYTVKESLAIKAVFSPATKNHVDMVVFTCRGCAITATEMKGGKCKLAAKAVNLKKYDDDSREFLEVLNKEKSKAIKTLLLKKFDLKEMNWSTLVAKCEPIQPKEKKAVEAVADTVAKAC